MDAELIGYARRFGSGMTIREDTLGLDQLEQIHTEQISWNGRIPGIGLQGTLSAFTRGGSRFP